MNENLQFEPIEPSYLSQLDLRSAAIAARRMTPRCLRFELTGIDWAFFVFLAPKDEAFFLLRPYQALSRSLALLARNKIGTVGTKLESAIKQSGLRKRSLETLYCFGMLTELNAQQYEPSERNGLLAGRLFSLAVPKRLENLVRAHFDEQFRAFRSDVAVRVPVSELLFITSDDFLDRRARLVLQPVARMSPEDGAAIVSELQQLTETCERARLFVNELRAGVRVSGAWNLPDPRECSASNRSLWGAIREARLRLVMHLGWPHVVDHFARQPVPRRPPDDWIQAARSKLPELVSFSLPTDQTRAAD